MKNSAHASSSAVVTAASPVRAPSRTPKVKGFFG